MSDIISMLCLFVYRRIAVLVTLFFLIEENYAVYYAHSFNDNDSFAVMLAYSFQGRRHDVEGNNEKRKS